MSSSRSPNKVASAPKIQLINGVSKFKNSYNPVITKQNKVAIEAKLAVEKQSTVATTQRIFNNNLYLNYTKNPFMNLKGKQHRFSNNLSYSSVDIGRSLLKPRQKKLSAVPKEKSIMDQMNLLQEGKKVGNLKKLNRFKKINDIIMQSTKISNKITGQLERQRIIKSSLAINQPISPKKEIYRQNIGLNDVQLKKIKQLSIDEIAGTLQQNFFFHEGHKKINIFKCINQNNEIQSPVEQLKEYKFCFDRIITPTLRDISLMSREMITTSNVPSRNILDSMRNQQLSIRQKQVRFIDLMGFACGRLTPDVILQLNRDVVIKINKNESEAGSQQQQDDTIIYRKNNETKMNTFKNNQQQIDEINQFSHIQLSKQQIQFRKKCQKLKQRVKSLLSEKQSTLQKSIYDREIHKSYTQRVANILTDYLPNKQMKFNDISKKVRKNKIFKNRDQAFRLSVARDVLLQKNQIDQMLNKAINS